MISVSLSAIGSFTPYSEQKVSTKAFVQIGLAIVAILSGYYYQATSRDRNFNKVKRNTIDYSD